MNLKIFKRKGFSLTEIVIAVALLGMVIVVVCGVFVKGLEAIKKGKYRAAGIHLIDKKFAEFNNFDLGNSSGIIISDPNQYIKGFDHANGDSIPWNSPKGTVDYVIYGTEHMAGIDYDYAIKIEGYQDNMKKIAISVTWPDLQGQKNLEISKLLCRKQN
ncbi:MAG: prepilin-type N-terminal cleavage/methylation domain-containing protein [Candidatus Eremiobacterota bacterium]